MRSTRFRALSISALVLSIAVVGGLTATTTAAVAAPHHGIAKSDPARYKAGAKAAQARVERGKQLRATKPTMKANAAADDTCGLAYPSDDTNTLFAVRFAGTDRYKTAVCVSQQSWYDYDNTDADPSFVADAVVLARGDLFPDALAGGPLAAQVEGPLLLTKSTTLLPEVRAEILRVLAPGGKVYLLGSTGSLSSGVESTIRSMGFTPVRLGGSDRFQTAIAIAKAMPDTSEFFFTTGMNYPDALAAGNAAAWWTAIGKYDSDSTTGPVPLLFTKDSTMPASTANFAIQRGQEFGVWGLYTAGRSGDAAAAKAFGSDSLSLRYVGSDRYNTAFLVDQDFFTNLSDGKMTSNFVGITNGLNYPDALAATVQLTGTGSPLLLTPPTKLNSATATFLRNHAGDVVGTVDHPVAVFVYGSSAGAVSDSVMIAARNAFTPAA